MSMIRITQEEAAAAMIAAADPSTGRIAYLVATTQGDYLSDDKKVADAVEELSYHRLFAFDDNGPFGYGLAVMAFGKVTYWDVPSLAESRLETLREFAQWVVSLDDPEGPGFEARKAVSMNQIIAKAREALGLPDEF